MPGEGPVPAVRQHGGGRRRPRADRSRRGNLGLLTRRPASRSRLWFASLVLATPLALLLAREVACREARSALETLRAERAAAGDPLEATAAVASLSLGDQETTALATDAVASLSDEPEGQDVLASLPERGRTALLFGAPREEPPGPEVVDAFLEANAHALALAAEVVARPRGELALDPLGAPAARFGDLAARFCLRARRSASRGAGEAALADLGTALALLRRLEAPGMVSRELDGVTLVVATLESVLATSEPGAAACRALAASLVGRVPGEPLAREIATERRRGLEGIAHLRAGELDDAAQAIALGGICLGPDFTAHRTRDRWLLRAFPWTLDRDETDLVSLTSRLRDLVRRPSPAAYREAIAIEEDECAALPASDRVTRWLFQVGYGGAWRPATGAIGAALSVEARLATARLALEARARRIESRALPEVSALAPVLDPWSDAPLRAARRGEGLVVWSVGPDGRDDGGRETEELDTSDPAAPRRGDDLRFELAR